MNVKSRLFAKHIQQLAPGTLDWIGLRPARKAPLNVVKTAEALAGLGLKGDRRCELSPGSARQVTVISAEHIALIARYLKRDIVPPALLRRNLVVSGINLNALRYQQFSIGEAVFEASAQCHPCSRMNEVLGDGAVAAMYGYGGLCCKVVKSGLINCGDTVQLLDATKNQQIFDF